MPTDSPSVAPDSLIAPAVADLGRVQRGGVLAPSKGGPKPPRATRENTVDLGDYYRRIEDECKGGLPNEKRTRLDEARINQDFYDLNFQPYVTAWDIDKDAVRTSAVMQRVVQVLTADLYKTGPTRKIADAPEVTEYLDALYKSNAVDALIQEADALSTVHQVAALEVRGEYGPGSESRPIGVELWGGDQISVWLDPDNARKPVAVATIDAMDEQRRIRLWTPDERITYVTSKLGPSQTAGGTAFREQKRDRNPYGILPFAFVHHKFPACFFWSGGPGTNLRQLNAHVNFRLSRIADDILHGRPIGVAEGVAPDFQFPRDYKRGMFTSIPPAVLTEGGTAAEKPELRYVTCDFSYVAADLDDLQKYLDHTLEMFGVPAGAVRLDHSNIQSGVAIVAEQIPILTWAEARQRPFGYYERDLAEVVLTVSAAHAANNGVSELLDCPIAAMQDVTAHLDLSCRWKSLLGPMLAMQRQQYDTFRFQYQLISKTQWVMETYSLNRDEAEEYVVETAMDSVKEAELFKPPPQPAPNGQFPPGQEPLDATGNPVENPDSGPAAEPGKPARNEPSPEETSAE